MKTPIDILDSMVTIIKDEHNLLRRGVYRACGGTQFCAVGAAWASAGVPATKTGDWLNIVGEDRARDFFLYPALEVVYNALNAAALQYVQHEATPARHLQFHANSGSFIHSHFERLFETTDIPVAGVLRVIAIAREALMPLYPPDAWECDNTDCDCNQYAERECVLVA